MFITINTFLLTDSCASRYDKNEMLQKYKESGLQEDLCFAEVKVEEDLKGL